MTKTPNLNLNVPDYRDERWDIPVNENWNLLDTAVAGKQATLTFDTTPTSGSTNPVTSNGIYNAIQNIDALPSQTGQSGKFLTTNGSSASWEIVSATGDNKSITKNTSNELQTVGVINSRDSSTAIKTWTGTRAQYDAIVTKDPNTLYNITDDTDVSLTILEALYPVGSVYETTNATCPLSSLISGSTWVEETSRILVDKYESGTEWWELYSDGWCRQGGMQTIGTNGYGTVNFLKVFIGTDYSFLCDIGGRDDSTAWHIYPTSTFTASTMQLRANLTGYTLKTRWVAEGYTSTTTTHKRFRRVA